MFSHNFDWLWEIFLRSPITRKTKIEHCLSWNGWFSTNEARITFHERRRLTSITNDIRPILQLFASQGRPGVEYFKEIILAWSFLGGEILGGIAEEMGIIIARVFQKGDVDIAYLMQLFETIINGSTVPLPARVIEELMVHSLYLMKLEDVRKFYFTFFSKNYRGQSFPLIVEHMVRLIDEVHTEPSKRYGPASSKTRFKEEL